jgi:TonB-dependent receptor
MKRFFTSALLLCSLTTSALFAQGVISGTVYDKATGETIIGASVVEKTTGAITITDFDGKYSFDLGFGFYTLEFSYIGYPKLTIENVQVEDKEITYQDVTMSDEEGINLDGVVVTAQRTTNSEVGVLMLRKESIVVADNIGAQEMARYGASDAGGALKKVTGTSVEGGKYIFVRGLGDRYSLAQLNGLTIPSTDPYRNSAQLDLIPTSLIDNISTAKTSSPDQPGNFTGGNVNIITKKFPEIETFNISLSGGFNAQSNLNDDFLTQGTIGQDYFGYDNTRAIPSALTNPDILPLLNASSSRDARRGDEVAANALQAGSQSIINQVTPNRTNSFIDHGLTVSYGNRFDFEKSKLGVIATASFKQDYQSLQNFRVGIYEIADPTVDTLQSINFLTANRSILNPTLSGLVGVTYRMGQNNEIGALAMYNHTATTFSQTQIGERRDAIINPIQLETFRMQHVEQELQNFQLNGEHNFPNANNLKIEWRGSLVNSSQVEPQTRFFEYSRNTETNAFLFGGTDLQPPYLFWRDLQDEQVIGKLDITQPIGNSGSSIKVGGLYSNKDRVSRQDEFRFGRGAAATDLNEVGGNLNTLFSDDFLGVVGQQPNGRFDIGWYITDNTDPADNYSGSEEIAAGYGMLVLQATDKLKIVGGARLETTNINVVSQDTSIAAGIIDTLDVLPSVNLIYEVIEDFNIRASYSKTIARPNLREISPFGILEPDTNIREFGNPDLTRSVINNFDLRLEYFLGGNEVIALSGYYKSFTDPIARVQLAVNNVAAFQPQNVSEGELFGIELELRKNLGFITEKLQNFTFVSNASWISSSISTDNPTDGPFAILERNFVGQPDYIINAALNYVQPELGWDIALAANSVGDRVGNIGSPSGLRRDQIIRARTQLDFIASKKINNNLSVRVAVQNILDDPFKVVSPFRGSEFINEEFQQGVDLRFNISYTF